MVRMIKSMIMLLWIAPAVFSQDVGTTAPDFTHNTLDHGTISLDQYRGKVVYLFFFGWG